MLWTTQSHQNDITDEIRITVGQQDEVIKRTSQIKYLGIVVDEQLNWKSHINQLVGKLSSIIGILTRTNKLFPRKVLMMLYYSLIYSSLTYGIVLWGSSSKQFYRRDF